MPYLYKDIGDTINRSKWKVRIPDDYEPYLPQAYLDNPSMIPIYDSQYSGGTWSESAMSIMEIAIAVDRNVEVVILNNDDIKAIKDLIDMYIKLVAPIMKDQPDTNPGKQIFGKIQKLSMRMVDPYDNAGQAITTANDNFVPQTNLQKLFSIFNRG